MNTHVVIMAGGIGSRFWPMSTQSMPKQFVDVMGVGLTMMQMTVERFLPLCPAENMWVVTGEGYVEDKGGQCFPSSWHHTAATLPCSLRGPRNSSAAPGSREQFRVDGDSDIKGQGHPGQVCAPVLGRQYEPESPPACLPTNLFPAAF